MPELLGPDWGLLGFVPHDKHSSISPMGYTKSSHFLITKNADLTV